MADCRSSRPHLPRKPTGMTFPRWQVVLLFLSPLSSRGFAPVQIKQQQQFPTHRLGQSVDGGGSTAATTGRGCFCCSGGQAGANSPGLSRTSWCQGSSTRRGISHQGSQLRSTRGNGREEEADYDNDLRVKRRSYAGGEAEDEVDDNDHLEDESEEDFLRRELAHLESLEELLSEFDIGEDDEDGDAADEGFVFQDVNDDGGEVEDPVSFLAELLESIDDEMRMTLPEPRRTSSKEGAPSKASLSKSRHTAASALETALMQGVVPVGAGVGDDSLPGDFGFDPLHLSERDLILPVRSALLRMLTGGRNDESVKEDTEGDNINPPRGKRPRALILRDYREAEIRHSRLAMLAAMIWPLQEMLDRLLLDEDLYGPLLYGPVTLPYFPLLMTAILLLLGYLDIYSMAIKEMDDIGDAYLPGDCFWDPLRILAGTAPVTKRRMQERELFNGRAAMLAVAAFAWEELVTGLPVIEIEGNELLFQPLYQVPIVQSFLDAQFSR